MKTVTLISLCAMLIGVAGGAHAQVGYATGKNLNECHSDCGLLQKVGDSLVISALDRSGRPVKVASQALQPNGYNLRVNTSPPESTTTFAATATAGITTRVTTTTYETRTQHIIVTVTFIYAADGTLLDIMISEKRIDKRQEK